MTTQATTSKNDRDALWNLGYEAARLGLSPQEARAQFEAFMAERRETAPATRELVLAEAETFQ